MKKSLLLFALIVSSCSSFKSGLTIQANETFILGESNSKNYSAELLNISNYEVKIRGEKKQNGEYTQVFTLPPKVKVNVYIISLNLIFAAIGIIILFATFSSITRFVPKININT